MQNINEIANNIINHFEDIIEAEVAKGSSLDIYTNAIAAAFVDIYKEIDKNKTPHIWTSLSGKELDATGVFLNIPRKDDESDNSYKYRLLNWMLTNAKSNTKAIQDALIKPIHASNIEYIPLTNGCGTGTCYVLPKEYTQENIKESIAEAQDIIKSVASPSLHVDYIVPEIKNISLEIYIKTTNGDNSMIKDKIENIIKDYINKIAPGKYLSLGAINKIGVNEHNVEYFNVLNMLINGNIYNKKEALQTIESKFIFDSIYWIEG